MSAVLVVGADPGWLPQTLDALARSTLLPDRLVAVDGASASGSGDPPGRYERLRRMVPALTVVEIEPGLPLGRAVARGVDALGPEAGPAPEWLWLLHGDTAVEPSTLRRLVDAVRRSPSVGVAGPKVVQEQDPRRLVSAGHQLTRTGRVLGAPREGELDQGQYDTRTDVLAVATAGMLLRRSVFEAVGGFDPAFPEHGGDLDLGWRAQLTGHRVLLVPEARVRAPASTSTAQAGAGEPAPRARRAARRAARRVCLTRCSPLLAPVLAVWMLLAAVVSAALLLLLKRPRAAWDELSDLGALLIPLPGVGARWRFRGRARLRRRDLRTLFAPPGQGLRRILDRVQDALTPERLGPAAPPWPAPPPQPASLGEPTPVRLGAQALPRSSGSPARRALRNPGFLAVAAVTALALVGLRESVRAGLLDPRGRGLSAGQLGPVTTDASGLWHSYWDAWHGSGLGTDAPASPHLAVLAALSWLPERLAFLAEGRSTASVALALVLVLGMPLATGAAYLAGRVVPASRWARAGVALAWGTASVTAAAVADGRVTVVLAAALLPLVAAGVARTAAPRGSPTVAFATALGLGLLATLVPALIVVGALVALLLLVVGPSRAQRARALVVLVVPLALQGPALMALGDPARLLAAPGLLAATGQAPVPSWALALTSLRPVPSWLTFLGVPLVAAGVLGLNSRAGSREGRHARVGLAALGVLGLALALGASRVVVGTVLEPDGTPAPATPWAGVGVQLLLLALLAGALLGSGRLPALLTGRRWSPRRLATGAGLVVVVAAVLLSAATVGAGPLDATVRVGERAAPPAVLEQAQGPLATRLLVLERLGGSVGYELVGQEPGDLLRSLPPAQPTTDLGLADVVDALAAPSTGRSAEPLADLGIGFVTVRAPADDPLARALDTTPGLTRLAATDGAALWRVPSRPSAAEPAQAVPPSRVRLTTSAGAVLQAVPVTGPHGAVDTELTAGAAGRRVVFAEPPEWAERAQVRFDGVALTALAGQRMPTYELPQRPGRLTADVTPSSERWSHAQLAFALFVAYLAVPFGNRRSRGLR